MTASAGAEHSGILSLKESIVCTSLLDPVALASGESLRVDLTVGLDVGAPSETQSASTKISMVASLSNATPVDFGDNVCRGDFEPVPATDTTTSPTATPTPSPTPTPTPSPTIVSPPDFGSRGGILGNTAQWFQEYAIVVPFLAFAGGSSVRFFVWRRRARRSPHPRGSTPS
jgi:hypothetical protein